MKAFVYCLALLFTAGIGFAADAEKTPSATAPSSQYEKAVAEAQGAVAAAANDVASAQQTLAKANEADRPKLAEALNTATANLAAAKARVAGLTDGAKLLRDQDPIQMLLSELRQRRDALAADASPAAKAQVDQLDGQIATLTKAVQSGGGSVLGWGFWLAALGVLAASIAGMLWAFRKQTAGAANDAAAEGAARVQLAQAVTMGAMLFIMFVSLLALGISGYGALLDGNRSRDFFDMAKWVLGAVLPVIGAWVGGVMAYYFGKENFRAGAENAEKLVRLTVQQKLEQKKAGDPDVGLEMAKITSYRLAAGATLDTVQLKEFTDKFTSDHPRLPIVDATNRPLACLHSSTVNQYLTGLTDAQKADQRVTTFAAMKAALKWDPTASFATVGAEDSLVTVQTLIRNRKECDDVFVTADGTPGSAVLRWITNDDIVKVANT